MANNGLGLRVWIFDAGGPGVISGQLVVKEIMRRLGNDLKMDDENLPLPCHHADVMIGTQLGAVAALLMGRLHLPIDQVMEAIGMIGDEVFAEKTSSNMLNEGPLVEAPESLSDFSSTDSSSSMSASPTSETAPSSPLQRAMSYGTSFARLLSGSFSLLTPKATLDTAQSPHRAFSTEKLRRVMIQILENHGFDADTRLIEANPRCKVAVVCASVYNANEVVLLRNYESGPSYNDYTIVDAVLATMATPPWFNPVSIGSGFATQTFTGGPMKTSNPINEALKEIRRIYKRYPIGSIISIGSGIHEVNELRKSTKDGLNEMLLKMAHDCDDTAEEAKDRFNQIQLYQRFSVLKKMDKIDIRDWGEDCFDNIATQTQSYIRMADINTALDVAVRHLQGDAGYILPTVEAITSSLQSNTVEIAPPSYSKFWQEYKNDD